MQKWAPIIANIELRPSKGGAFEIILDGDLIFSKKQLKRHAEPGEVGRIVEARLGPPIERE